MNAQSQKYKFIQILSLADDNILSLNDRNWRILGLIELPYILQKMSKFNQKLMNIMVVLTFCFVFNFLNIMFKKLLQRAKKSVY